MKIMILVAIVLIYYICHVMDVSTVKDPMSSALLFPGEFLRAKEIIDLPTQY